MCLEAPAALAEVLKNGSKGTGVVVLQQALEKLGYSVGGADGVYGTRTEQAVLAFQRANRLKTDGKAGTETQSALYRLAGGAVQPTQPPAASATAQPPAGKPSSAYFGGDYTTLRSGDSGARVRLLQTALNTLGYSCGAVDGRYGSGTVRAVCALQSAYGLSSDGKAGKLTMMLIETLLTNADRPAAPTAVPTAVPTAAPTASPSAGPVAPSRTLYPGDSGTDVISLQTRLSQLGYYGETCHGYYDEVTRSAVLLFQRLNGLDADGVAGKNTNAALFSAYALSASAALPTAVPTAAPTNAPIPTASPAPQTVIPTRTLRLGYTGADVLSVQQRLTQLGYYTGSLDSYYGNAVIAAVKAFQQRNGLSVDGLAGRATNACLFSAQAVGAAVQPTASPTASPTVAPDNQTVIPSRVMYSGSTGDDVLSVQRRLQQLGYYSGTPNGTYDHATIEAVRAFQLRNSLNADGLAGPKTYQILYSSNAVVNSAAPAQPTTQPNAYLTLKKGNASTDVAQMQARLALLGYVTGTMGRYDNATVTAVRNFQTANGLQSDGIAGPETLTALYSSPAKAGPNGVWTGTVSAGPAASSVKLLHWQNEIKSTLANRQIIMAFDPVTGLSWNLQILSLGRHCDVEPATAADTAVQYRAFGNREDWGPKPVYIQLPDGRWSLATMLNVAHGTSTIKNNNFNGQNCVHFLRDMDEAKKNDPNWGVQNQQVLRECWKYMTGQTVE